MKTKLILATLLFTFCLFANAQLVIKTDVSQDLYFDTELKDWQVVKDHDVPTIFKLAEDMKTLSYTENGVTDDFTIKTWEFNDEKAVFDLIIHDTSYNEFTVIIDGINLFLSMTTQIEGTDFMLLYNIVDIINESEE
ncbi:MAG: hypothetical protein WCY77_07570 [Weeksellaceae bacterium]